MSLFFSQIPIRGLVKYGNQTVLSQKFLLQTVLPRTDLPQNSSSPAQFFPRQFFPRTVLPQDVFSPDSSFPDSSSPEQFFPKTVLPWGRNVLGKKCLGKKCLGKNWPGKNCLGKNCLVTDIFKITNPELQLLVNWNVRSTILFCEISSKYPYIFRLIIYSYSCFYYLKRLFIGTNYFHYRLIDNLAYVNTPILQNHLRQSRWS